VITAYGQETCDLACGQRLFNACRDGLFGLALACGPFSDDTKTALKTSGPQSAPEFGTVPAAICPFLFQPQQLRGQAALVAAVNVLSFSANDLADRLRLSPFSRTICLLAALEAQISKFFRRCQKLGAENLRAKTASQQNQFHLPAMRWKVGRLTLLSAMYMA